MFRFVFGHRQTRQVRPAQNRFGTRRSRLCVEHLEERLAPALLEVVPSYAVSAQTAFSDLSSALSFAHAGDVIQIEPGASPGSASVFIGNLTIQGDPAFGGAGGLKSSGTEVGTLAINNPNITVTNLFLDNLTIATGVTGITLSNSIINGGTVSQTFGPGNNGGNRIIGNTFLNNCRVILGNTAGSTTDTASGDTIASNYFAHLGNHTPLAVINETSLSITGNRIVEPQSTVEGVFASDCVGIVSGNVVQVVGPSLEIRDGGNPAAPRSTNLTVTNNVFGTGVGFPALVISHQSTANSFTVSVVNNTLVGAAIGVEVTGNGAGGSNDYGSITINGNDFRGYSGSGFNFALQVGDAQSNMSSINARGNIFSVANPQTVVRVLPSGTTVDTSGALTGGPANLDAMFLTLGGGPPTAAQHAALDNASLLTQASAAVRRGQALSVLVDSLYVSLLGRPPSTAEEQGWVSLLAAGATQEQIIAGFLASPEYYFKVTQGHENPNGAWVQSLYVNLLHRQGSGVEINGWLTVLNGAGAAGQAAVAQAFLSSAEFRGIQVQAMYGGTAAGIIYAPDLLKRPTLAPPAELAVWVNSNLDLLRIEALILSGPEFGFDG